ARYPNINHIDVVNEPINTPPTGFVTVGSSTTPAGTADPNGGGYINALGGTGTTGYDWIITSFQLARQYFPNAQLMINEYSVENSATRAATYATIINLLKARNLIDGVGIQGHAFSTAGQTAATINGNLATLAATGVPLYITEYDSDGPGDADQLTEYQRVFPLFWQNPAVKGVTLWGYRPGHWRTAQGAPLVDANNNERPSLVWLRNDLRINKLPLNFKGELSILKNGYDIDLSVKSMESDFEDLFTALPPEYVTWLDSTKVKGEIDIALSMKGRYDATTKRQPTIKFHTAVRDGYIEYKTAPVATSDINLNLDAVLPSLNMEELSIKLDSLTFKLGKEKFRAFASVKGMENMQVKAMMKGKVDLETLDKSIGIQNLDLKGFMLADVDVNGIYSAKKHLFPKAKGRVLLKDGYIKTEHYPNPITNINLDINAENTNGKFSDTWIQVSPATFTFEGEPFNLNATFSNLDDVAYDVKAKGLINVGKVYRVFAQQGVDVDGMIKADVRLKGRQSYATNGEYGRLDNSGTLELRKIKASMDAFPKDFVITHG
ncbi:MAG: hypothetical protein EOO39_28455, partial [Cytophagaceae bacterium]